MERRLATRGRKAFVGCTEDGTCRGVKAQVCDVNKDLLSVSKVVKSGITVVFHPLEAFIQDLESQERVWLKEEGGTYTLSLWIKNQPF